MRVQMCLRTDHGANLRRAVGLVSGVVADTLLGDPRRGHPVALFGTAATALERAVYADSRSRGAVFAMSSVVLAVAPVLSASRLSAWPSGPGPGASDLALTATATWAVTGARSLTAEASRIGRALED